MYVCVCLTEHYELFRVCLCVRAPSFFVCVLCVAVEWVRRDQEELNLLTNDSISASLKISNARENLFPF